MRVGESGTAIINFLRPEIQKAAIEVGQTFKLSVHGMNAAVGQIVSVDDEELRRHVEPAGGTEPEDDDNPPRIVSLLGKLSAGLCVLLFARNAAAWWQILVGLAGCAVVGIAKRY